MDCDAQLANNLPIHTHIFRRAIVTRKVGCTDLVLGVQSDLLVGLCMHYYRGYNLCHPDLHPDTHTETAFDQFIWKAQPDELIKMEKCTQEMSPNLNFADCLLHRFLYCEEQMFQWHLNICTSPSRVIHSVIPDTLTLYSAVVSDSYIQKCSMPSRSNLHF